ncbi:MULTISPECIES: hypothetical protein [Nostocales]|nr:MULTISPECIES: hypothetical protein [Nostocales]
MGKAPPRAIALSPISIFKAKSTTHVDLLIDKTKAIAQSPSVTG